MKRHGFLRNNYTVIGTCMLLMFYTSSFSQTEKGRYLIGGSVDISDAVNGQNNNFNFSVAPTFAVFVVKNFAVGAKYSITIANAHTFDATQGKYTSITTLQTYIGPYLKYYGGKKPLKGVVSFTGGYSSFTALGGSAVISVNGFALQGNLGMAYFFNPYVSLESTAYINAQGYETLLPGTRIGFSIGIFALLDKKKPE